MAGFQSILRLLSITAIALACQLFNLASGQTGDAKTKPSASISGRITIGDKPAPGILVSAVLNSNNGQSVLAQTTSDSEGNYRLSGLPSGPITITPFAPLYVFSTNPTFLQGQRVDVSADEAINGIDFRLVRGGVITGRVTDAGGKPVIEQRIELQPVDERGTPTRGSMAWFGNYMMYQTDDRGVYRLYGLFPGHYKVSAGEQPANSGNFMSAGYFPKTFYPDATDFAKAAIVDVTEGGEAKTIDIKLGVRSRTYAVSGRITDAETNRPLAGLGLSIGPVAQSGGQTYVNSTASPATPTNTQGEFHIEGVAPGHYAIVATKSWDRNASSTPNFYSDPVLFDVTESDVTDLEIKAQHGISLAGVVVIEGTADKNALSKLSQISISAYDEPVSGRLHFSAAGASKINSDGTFHIDDLRPGKIQFNLGYAGPGSGPPVKITRVERNGVIQNRVMDLDNDASDFRIYLSYGTGSVKGEVKIQGGTLPSDVMLFIAVSRPDEPQNHWSAQADSRGHFVVTGIPAGTYEVTIHIVSMGDPKTLPREFPREQKQPVTVNDNSETEILFTIDLTKKEGP
jgi:protocatechuate 3,4-dioxygenase beta subunit